VHFPQRVGLDQQFVFAVLNPGPDLGTFVTMAQVHNQARDRWED